MTAYMSDLLKNEKLRETDFPQSPR
jgi:hypothetical protein